MAGRTRTSSATAVSWWSSSSCARGRPEPRAPTRSGQHGPCPVPHGGYRGGRADLSTSWSPEGMVHRECFEVSHYRLLQIDEVAAGLHRRHLGSELCLLLCLR